jgi:hypothetical protein
MENNILLKEELKNRVTNKINSSRLFQHCLEASAKYPCGILIRNGGKSTRLSDGQYESFMAKAESVLPKQEFPHLYMKDKYRLRPHGGGFLIPIGKSYDVRTIIHSLNQINKENNFGLKIEKSKDGPCEDGRNVTTEWKLLPPDITEENAEKYFSDFGSVILPVVETKKSLYVTFSIIFDTLPLISLINPHLYKGSRWFTVFNNRPTICRFVSSLSCSKCQLQGHHSSKCPEGLSEITEQLRKMVLKPKASTSLSKQNQNQDDIMETKSTKKNVKRRIPKPKKELDLKDSRVDSIKKAKNKVQNVTEGEFQQVGMKPSIQLINLQSSLLSVKGTGSDLGNNSMDTSLDLFQDKGSAKRHDNLSGANTIGIEIVGGLPPMTIDDNFFENDIDT